MMTGILSPLRLPFRQAGTGSEIRRLCRFAGVPRGGNPGVPGMFRVVGWHKESAQWRRKTAGVSPLTRLL